MTEFRPAEFEKKWREKWESNGIYHADMDSTNKFYNLWMFPYPSAEGVHVGTIFSSTGSDVYGRFKRMQGYEVFQPMGYDSFGIHSENYALKIGEAPAKFTTRAIANYERQFKEIGHGYDWSRPVTTSNEDYYRWTQWLFIQMFKAGFAYKKKSSVNWCPGCKTVLADEQIVTPAMAGKWPKQYATLEEVPEGLKVCERCGNEPERKDLEQWFLKITDYADRLLEGLTRIDWSERVAVAQKEWIGKKEGTKVKFQILNPNNQINSKFQIQTEVFTTRIDTIMGVTFLVVAPEVARDWMKQGWEASLDVKNYIEKALNSTEENRKKTEKEKTGVKTDLTAVNPVSGVNVPVYVADYVLKDVGTGVVMGVPTYDARDLDFAKKHELPVVQFEVENLEKITAQGKSEGWAESVTSFHLRDWLISRQRYWGAPIPMIECIKCGWVPVPEEQLPVMLPEIDDYQPEGEGKGPLANHPEFYETTCPNCGGKATRETDVMDTFVDSSWYFLRYPSIRDARAGQVPWEAEITKKWLPVDLYFGGAEHSVLHLMYARFVTKVLFDLKLVDFDEPFPRFFAHGLMIKDGAKMSKSKGNVVNPDEYIKKYGADALRLYLMFMGPMDGYPDFRDSGMEGMVKWLKRVWKLVTKKPIESNDLDPVLNNTILKVTEFLEQYKNNTAIAELMKFVNLAEETDGLTLKQIDILLKLLSPFAPHMTEEVWSMLGKLFSIHRQTWPTAIVSQDESKTIVVQVGGKVRGKFISNAGMDEPAVVKQALEIENVKKFIPEKYRIVFVPGKVINFV